ncbi:MAG: hypothetical protein IPM31_10825 [Anaerolineae bacterium]|nr:hypothetical protein [Anaerolineae bacterium]TVL97113.1 MAG: hypothetical protein CV087_22815 [Candidatus Brocadia sp. WS118]
MDDYWYEEELVPIEPEFNEVTKSTEKERQATPKARGVVRIDKPRWKKLDDESSYEWLTSGSKSEFYLVRLGFQFDVLEKAREQGVKFIFARCSAFLRSESIEQLQPTVYEMVPRDLHEGESHVVKLEIAPQIKLGNTSFAFGEASTDLSLGSIEPVTVGWPGKDEREPYWELRPKNKTLIGVRHLWLVIEAPIGCGGIRLATRVEGDLKSYFGIISVGPISRLWASRPSIRIG